MISPDFGLLLVTEVVRVLGPVIVKETKSRRIFFRGIMAKNIYFSAFFLSKRPPKYLANVVIARADIDLREEKKCKSVFYKKIKYFYFPRTLQVPATGLLLSK